uniref:Uncharacterized protein LOC100375643 n=1 Tax=Saccoglossus kowalevskii TaxID=10224 RepID=A0ABM0MVZ9_SACKO|nr:PREDICTED: uncharacterized protein LOC100375643 [Saccoglossus kowalevskii]
MESKTAICLVYIVVLIGIHIAQAHISTTGIAECYMEADGSDYRGAVSVTISGHTCQAWNVQTPHTHSVNDVSYPGGGLGEHNLCRNPTGKDGVWCYTTDIDTVWEYCEIGQPSDNCLSEVICPSEYSLGIEDPAVVPDSRISMSSYFKNNIEGAVGISKYNIKLNSVGSWCVSEDYTDVEDEYIQVDFGEQVYVTQILSQGNGNPILDDYHVTKYTFYYSNATNETGDGIAYTDDGGSIQVFNGNNDKDTVVMNTLAGAVYTRYIRIYLLEFSNFPCMRLGVYGCQGEHCTIDNDPCDPNPCNHAGICVRVSSTQFTCTCTGLYSGLLCDDSTVTCASGWYAGYEACYQLGMAEGTYGVAIEVCNHISAHVLYVGEREEQVLVSDWLNTEGIAASSELYTGMTYSSDTDDVINQHDPMGGAPDISTWTSEDLDPWSSGSPTADYPCVVLVKDGDEWKFRNSDCETTRFYVCEKSPVDGSWSDWSAWSECSVSCESGVRYRSRSCDDPEPYFGGATCMGDEVEEIVCDELCPWVTCPGSDMVPRHSSCYHIKSQPTDSATYDESISICEDLYNGGHLVYLDDIGEHEFLHYELVASGASAETAFYTGLQYDGHDIQFDDGGGQPDLSSWAIESRSLWMPGYPTGSEQCVAMAYNSTYLEWLAINVNCSDLNGFVCEVHQVDGDWSDWGNWSDCSVTCGNDLGVQSRSRTCTNPSPLLGGAECQGDSSETSGCGGSCPDDPVNGGWTDWTDWSDCSRCYPDIGKQSRTRNCTNPEPSEGGTSCTGEDFETKTCDVDCDITCHLEWIELPNACIKVIDAALDFQASKADCESKGEGAHLIHIGYAVENSDVNLLLQSESTTDAFYTGILYDFTTDSLSDTTHTPVSISPLPWYDATFYPLPDGYDCIQYLYHEEDDDWKWINVNCTEEANGYICEMNPVHGGWSEWSSADCSVTCYIEESDGTRTGGELLQTRTCTNPVPSNGGNDCGETSTQVIECGIEDGNACPPEDGNWGSWTDSGDCSVKCGNDGIRRRERTCSNPPPINGGSECSGSSETFVACDSDVQCTDYNLAIEATATQSSITGSNGASLAIDGFASSYVTDSTCAVTDTEYQPWLMLNLGQPYDIYKVIVTLRKYEFPLMNDVVIRIGPHSVSADNTLCGTITTAANINEVICATSITGNHVHLTLNDAIGQLIVCEVEVYSDNIDAEFGFKYGGSQPDSAFSANRGESTAKKGRLNHITDSSAWYTGSSPSNTDWLKISLPRVAIVRMIAVQARPSNPNQYVKTFYLSYSSDDDSWINYEENGERKLFGGNIDGSSVVMHSLEPIANVAYLKFNPHAWKNRIALRVEIYGQYEPVDGGWSDWTVQTDCSVACGSEGIEERLRSCDNPAPQYGGVCTGSSTQWFECEAATVCSDNEDTPLGMEDGSIADSSITVSEPLDGTDYSGLWARLNDIDEHAWVPNIPDVEDWIKLTFQDAITLKMVGTQGMPATGKYVKSYYLSYSLHGSDWVYYQEEGSAKFHPQSWNVETGGIAMRIELYGEYTPDTEYASIDGESETWCMDDAVNSDYFEIDLSVDSTINMMASRGTAPNSGYMKTYYISYSDDGSSWSDYLENGETKLFNGNFDASTVVKNTLSNPFTARYIRFHPQSWEDSLCMSVEVFGYTAPVNGGWGNWGAWSTACSVSCGNNGINTRSRNCINPTPSHGGLDCSEEDKYLYRSCDSGTVCGGCFDPLGVEYKTIADEQITASSNYAAGQYEAYYGRISSDITPYQTAWWAADDDDDPWLQVELVAYAHITMIATRGDVTSGHYVKQYYLSYGNNTTNFDLYLDGLETKLFGGNLDSSTTVRHTLDPVLRNVRVVRFHPVYYMGHIAMAVELYGCHQLRGVYASTYTVLTYSKLVDNNDKSVQDVTQDECQQLCEDNLDFTCRSAEYKASAQECVLSKKNDYCDATLNDATKWDYIRREINCLDDNYQGDVQVSVLSTYILVDLGGLHTVTMVVTTADVNNWVTEFQLFFTENGEEWVLYRERGIPKIFAGNFDSATWVRTPLLSPIVAAKLLKISPTEGSIHNGISGNVIIYGCTVDGYTPKTVPPSKVCFDPLGMASGAILDTQITSNTVLDIDNEDGTKFQPFYGRLFNSEDPTTGRHGWFSNTGNHKDEYFQVDLGDPHFVTMVALEIIEDAALNEFMDFKIAYSQNGVNWMTMNHVFDYDDQNERFIIYKLADSTSDDRFTMHTRYVRLLNAEAETSTNQSQIAAIELYGCAVPEGASLASIESMTEQEFFTSKLDSYSKDYGINQFSMGFNRKDSNAFFEWSDGSVSLFTNWAVGHPHYGPDYQCSQIGQDGRWFSHDCSINTTVSDVSCQYDTSVLSCREFQGVSVIRATYGRTAGSEICQHGTLTTSVSSCPSTMDVAEKLRADCDDTSTSMVLSAKQCTGNILDLSCMNDDIITIQDVLYGKSTGNSICAVPEDPETVDTPCFTTSVTDKLKSMCDGEPLCRIVVDPSMLGDDPCLKRLEELIVFYTCDPHNTDMDGCEDSWTEFDDNCFLVNDTYIHYSEAANECERHHATLVCIPDNATQNFVTDLVESSATTDVWIGCHKRWDNTCYWSNGLQPLYQNFKPSYVYSSDMPCSFMSEHISYFWDGSVCSDFKGFVCQQTCMAPVGLESPVLSDTLLSVSSTKLTHTLDTFKWYSRLNNEFGAWSPSYNDEDQWIMVNLTTTMRITKLAMQGHPVRDSWVETLKLMYSFDGTTMSVYSINNVEQLLSANSDSTAITYVYLESFLAGNFIKLVPQTWHNDIAMRFELYGCNVQDATPHVVKVENSTALIFNKNGSISCQAFGIPRPSITWEKNGETFTTAWNVDIVNTDIDSYNTMSNIQFSPLYNDKGYYSCIAHNSYGNHRKTFYQSKEKPVIIGEFINCDDEYLRLVCPGNTFIDMTSVFYGREHNDVCVIADDIYPTDCVYDGETSLSRLQKQCGNKHECDIYISDVTFEDGNEYPSCDGVYKYVNVTYDCVDDVGEGAVNTVVGCDDEKLSFGCHSGHFIKVLSASYGRTDPNTCSLGADNNYTYSVDCVYTPSAVLDIARTNCDNKLTCAMNVMLYDVIGDECPGVPKYFEIDFICEAFDRNLALLRAAYQSTDTMPVMDASLATDGDLSTCSNTANETEPFWRVDLRESYTVGHVVVVLNTNALGTVMDQLEVRVGSNWDITQNNICDDVISGGQTLHDIYCAYPMVGRYVSIKLFTDSEASLSLCDVQVKNGIEEEATAIVCDDDVMSLTCADGFVFIQDVEYGRADSGVTCPASIPGQTYNSCTSTKSSVLAIVKQKCQGQRYCSIDVMDDVREVLSNHGEDPCPTTYKYLTVKHLCSDTSKGGGARLTNISGDTPEMHSTSSGHACKSENFKMVCEKPYSFINVTRALYHPVTSHPDRCQTSSDTLPSSCNAYYKLSSHYGYVLSDGVYPINVDGQTLKVYCDMTRNGGGWTLLVTAVSKRDWSPENVEERRLDYPSLDLDYSILSKANAIKNSGNESSFQYRLEANERGRYGGIWQAPASHDFVANLPQPTILLERFDSWVTDVSTIQNNLPWIDSEPWRSRPDLLTTSFRNTDQWAGSIVMENDDVYGVMVDVAPWIMGSSESSNPSAIWYWMREELNIEYSCNGAPTPYDVTEQVKERCDYKRSCTVPSEDYVFNDGCVENSKELEVTFHCSESTPSSETVISCEEDEQQLSITCNSGQFIYITEANYGRALSTVCPSISDNTSVSTCLNPNTKALVSGYCNGMSSCSIRVHPDYLGGDPCPAVAKYLMVEFTCTDERPSGILLARGCEDNGDVVLSCPNDYAIRIVTADLGRAAGEDVCTHRRNIPSYYRDTSCTIPDVLEALHNQCDNEQSCEVSVHWDDYISSDPCPGTYKYMEVAYYCLSATQPLTSGGYYGNYIHFRDEGHYLENHVIDTHHVRHHIHCAISCWSNSDCLSFNIKSSRDTDGYLCELNDVLKDEIPSDYTDLVGFEYFERGRY